METNERERPAASERDDKAGELAADASAPEGSGESAEGDVPAPEKDAGSGADKAAAYGETDIDAHETPRPSASDPEADDAGETPERGSETIGANAEHPPVQAFVSAVAALNERGPDTESYRKARRVWNMAVPTAVSFALIIAALLAVAWFAAATGLLLSQPDGANSSGPPAPTPAAASEDAS